MVYVIVVVIGFGEFAGMFCSKCGKKLLDDAVFCPYCGAKVGDAIPSQPEQPEPYYPSTLNLRVY